MSFLRFFLLAEIERDDGGGRNRMCFVRKGKNPLIFFLSPMKYAFSVARPPSPYEKCFFGGRLRKIVCGTFDTLLLCEAADSFSVSSEKKKFIQGYYVFNTFMIYHKSGSFSIPSNSLLPLIQTHKEWGKIFDVVVAVYIIRQEKKRGKNGRKIFCR